ncbi:MAG: CocE/NonD family hydrolase [Sedimentisphaerales bacterium]|nr:CocE/NonD family hydrolase [Sedimentisphaerales bacterium]
MLRNILGGKCKSYIFVLSILVSVFISPQTIWAADNSFEVDVRADVKIPMRDGVLLSAHIFLPKAEGKFPVILVRSPYGKGDEKNGDGLLYGSKGYVFISQDCRGKGASEGEWEPFLNEDADGRDTQKWILNQPWCNGKIGTSGGSYVGFTQWMPAPNAGEHLKGIFCLVPLVDTYGDAAYIGGAYSLALMMGWGSVVSYRPGEEMTILGWGSGDWNKAYRTLPLREWDRAIDRKVQYLRDWVAHPVFDDYWAKRSVRNRWQDITVPIFTIGGWYDIFAKSVFDHINAVKSTSRSLKARNHQHLLMGPWGHGISRDGKVGDLDFGKDSVVNFHEIQTKWFDYWLKGNETGGYKWAPFRIFVMGRNQWRDEQEWPLERTRFTPYYFHSGGSANALKGDGRLSTVKPGNESFDRFVYDPNNPVPTLGGCNLVGCPAGPRDQTKAENRNDVLVFTSKELKTDLEVTGPVKVVLYAASSARDTDWTAKLVDVHPDGRPINLCDGIIRARNRESAQNPTLIKPGKIYRYEIDLWVTSNVFLAGHKIRAEISSSNFPRFDRNPNTGAPFGKSAEIIKATQTIYHDLEHTSHILLPVIP